MRKEMQVMEVLMTVKMLVDMVHMLLEETIGMLTVK